MIAKSSYTQVTSKPLSTVWQKWAAESKLLNVDQRTIIAKMVEQGISEHNAVEEVESLPAHPYFQAAEVIAQRLRKLESIMSIKKQLSSLVAKGPGIERRHGLSKAEFLDRYYSMNRPVILVDLMRNWKACSKWTPDYLKQHFGDEEVEIMTARELDPRYEVNSQRHVKSVKFGDYVRLVETCGESNDHYLVANNRLMENPKMRSLYDDIEAFPTFLDKDRQFRQTFFWFGPSGTITPLHHDTQNILLAQVRGRKRIKLISPEQSSFVYNNVAVFSDVDCEKPDLLRHPLFRNVTLFETELAPGEVLFLPVGWWHHVRSLDISISMSFTNFLFPNNYHWNNPQISRYQD